MRVLRVCHAGRDAAHRQRERALVGHGIDVTLVVPREWPDLGSSSRISDEPFRVVELDVQRAGDVYRHRYTDPAALRQVITTIRPDVLDVHEEPVSIAAQQWLRVAGTLPVAMYTAQNVDKRYPPPFAQFERRALQRVDALYPASRQAASVARGKGFAGMVEVLPTGYDDAVLNPGSQTPDDAVVVLGLVGRLLPEKGVLDAVRVLAAVSAVRSARLLLVGTGPELEPARRLAADLGVAESLDVLGWCPPDRLATLYRRMHVLLAPSYATAAWVERLGSTVVEALAGGALVAGYDCGVLAEAAGGAGLMVGEGDVQALADAVVRLVSDPHEYAWRRAEAAAVLPLQARSQITRRQIELYRGILSGAHERLRVARSAVRRREQARVEFGLPAHTAAGARPFAVPMLRRPTVASRALAGALDLAGSVLAPR